METKHTPTPWAVATPGKGKVAATIPIIYDANGHAVAHVLAGNNAAETIVTAVNSHEALVSALEKLIPIVADFHEFCAREDKPCNDPDAECRIGMGEWVEKSDVAALSQARAALELAKAHKGE